jgi:hypothetical protein
MKTHETYECEELGLRAELSYSNEGVTVVGKIEGRPFKWDLPPTTHNHLHCRITNSIEFVDVLRLMVRVQNLEWRIEALTKPA